MGKIEERIKKVTGFVVGNADKVAHVAVCALMVLLVAVVLLGVRRGGSGTPPSAWDWWTAAVTGAGVAFMAALAKEAWDFFTGGDCSLKDLLADLAGIVAAVALLMAVAMVAG